MAASGTAGTLNNSGPVWTNPSLTSYVPSTAASWTGVLWADSSNSVIVAPNTSYGGVGDNAPPPVFAYAGINAGQTFTWSVEALSFAYCSNGVSDSVSVLGWDDNL